MSEGLRENSEYDCVNAHKWLWVLVTRRSTRPSSRSEFLATVRVVPSLILVEFVLCYLAQYRHDVVHIDSVPMQYVLEVR